MTANGNPYIGPRAFRTGETLYGREHETRELIDLLISERIVLLYSPSGAGKTSLIHAAVIPQMTAEDYQVLPTIRPGATHDAAVATSEQNAYVARAIAGWEEGRPSGEDRVLDVPGITLATYLSQRSWIQNDNRLKLLVLDQFEEILTSNQDGMQAKVAFFRQLGDALKDRRIWALVSMREEYSAALDTYRHLLPTRLGIRFRLDLLSRGGAKAAIRNPARDAGTDYEDAALQHLIDELGTVREQTSDGTPVERKVEFIEPLYLQIACHRLWGMLPTGTRTITPAMIGRSDEEGASAACASEVEQALVQYYAEVIQYVSNETGCTERRIREYLEQEYVTPQGLRRQVLRGERETAGLSNEVPEALSRQSLLRCESRSGALWYEVTHDRLAGVILRGNAVWFEQNLAPFQRRAMLWRVQRRAGADQSAAQELLRGRDLRVAEQWTKEHPDAVLSDTDQQFLNDSRHQWRQGRNKRWIGSLAVVAVFLLGWGWAFWEQGNARTLQAERSQERARALLSESARQKWREYNHELSTLLAIQAYRLATHDGDLSHFGSWPEEMLRTALQSRPFAYSFELNQAPSEGDGETIVLSRRPVSVRIGTDRPTATQPSVRPPRNLVHRLKPNDTTKAARFSPTDRFLAVLNRKGVDLYEADSGHTYDEITKHWSISTESPPRGPLSFAKDEAHLAIALEGNVAQVWQLGPSEPRLVHQLSIEASGVAASSPITALACSTDCSWLAWGKASGDVGLVDLSTPEPLTEWVSSNRFEEWPAGLREHLKRRKDTIDFGVTSLLYLPDRQWLLAIFQHGPPRIFDLAGHGQQAAAAYLVPNAASEARLEIAQDIGLAARRIVNLDRSVEADVSHDERWVAVGGKRVLVGLWDLASTSTTPQTAANWNDDREPLQRIPEGVQVIYGDYREQPGLQAAVRAIRFTQPKDDAPDSATETADTWLLAADVRSNVRWWSLADLQHVGYARYREGNPSVIYALALLPNAAEDGNRLRIAFGGSYASGILRINDSLHFSPDPSVVLPPRIRALATDAENRWLLIATGNQDDWKQEGEWRHDQYSWLLEQTPGNIVRPVPLPGDSHTDGQWAAVASSQRGFLLTAGWDGQAIVWRRTVEDTWQPESLSLPNGEPDQDTHLLSAALHPSGQDLVIGTSDGRIWIWRTKGDNFREAPPLMKDEDAGIPIRALAFSPDGKMLVAGDDNGLLWVWDVDEGEYRRRPPVAAHVGALYDIAFADDGRFVTGGSDGRVNLWSTIDSKPTRALRLEGPTSETVSVAFAPSGDLVVAGDAEGYIHVWELGFEKLIDKACAAMSRNLSAKEWEWYVHTEKYECTCRNLADCSDSTAQRNDGD